MLCMLVIPKASLCYCRIVHACPAMYAIDGTGFSYSYSFYASRNILLVLQRVQFAAMPCHVVLCCAAPSVISATTWVVTAAPILLFNSSSSCAALGHRGSSGTPSRLTFLPAKSSTHSQHTHTHTHSQLCSGSHRFPPPPCCLSSYICCHSCPSINAASACFPPPPGAQPSPLPHNNNALLHFMAAHHAAAAAAAVAHCSSDTQQAAALTGSPPPHLQCQVSARLSGFSGSTSSDRRSLHSSTITTSGRTARTNCLIWPQET
jgi:hypothetical protein